jgi:hypothetical protein
MIVYNIVYILFSQQFILSQAASFALSEKLQ